MSEKPSATHLYAKLLELKQQRGRLREAIEKIEVREQAIVEELYQLYRGIPLGDFEIFIMLKK